jgi:hypothetical protein
VQGFGWQRVVAVVAGTPVLFASAAAIILGHDGLATLVIGVLGGCLTYAGLGLDMPAIETGSFRLSFRPPSVAGDRSTKGIDR